MLTISDLFDLDHTLAKGYLSEYTYPWEAFAGLKEFILRLGPALPAAYRELFPGVWVHESAKISPAAYLGSPCIIGAGTEVRHGAFIRGSVLVGEGCVAGNSAELKNALLFDGRADPPLQLRGGQYPGIQIAHGRGGRHLQRKVG